MRVAIVANDTRGGVEPYVALAGALKGAGVEVTVVAPSDFTDDIARKGLRAAALSGSVAAAAQAAGGGALRGMGVVVREAGARLRAWTRETLAACEDADALLGGVGGMVVGVPVAEKLGKPFIEAQLQPVRLSTGAFPGVLFPRAPRWPGVWRLTHRATDLALSAPFDMAMRKVRHEVLGLAERGPRPHGPILYGFSRHVLPALPQDDRPRYVTGYWTAPPDRSWRPPRDLERFLDSDRPVVSIGFGSMADLGDDASAHVLQAIKRVGAKAVLLTGWGGLSAGAADDDVFVARELPHGWLFPRMAAVVHHGGAGTTGAGLMAGVPSVVAPFGMDQPFWARRVAALGAGPAPIPRARLNADRLARALDQALNDAAIRHAAAALGREMRLEQGLASAVDRIAGILEPPAAPRGAA